MARNLQEIRDFLSQNQVFTNLPDQELWQVTSLAEEITLPQDVYIMRENEVSDEMYIIKSGEVEICKKDAKTQHYHHLDSLGSGAFVGEMSLIDNAPRSASVRTTQPTTFFKFSINQLLANDSRLGLLLTKNVAKILSKRMRHTNDVVVETLRRELEHTKARAELGRFILYVLIVVYSYVVVLKAVAAYDFNFVTRYVSLPLTAGFALILFIMMRRSGYPLSLYGLTWNNWKRSICEGVLFTLPILALIFAFKWLAIDLIPEFSTYSLVVLNNEFSGAGSAQLGAVLLILSYMISVPLQEFAVRGAVQGTLQELFIGKFKTFFAIIASNLLFSASHLVLNLNLTLNFIVAFVVFFLGLFWGWQFSRHRTLVGVCISHLMIGVYAFFILGVG